MKSTLRSLSLALLIPGALALAADDSGFRPLFNGKDLTGWKLRNPGGHASWSVKDGLLVNDAGQQHGTDLVTTEKFKDFTLRYEYRIPKGANSGMYLRGRHEIQILDDYETGQPSKGGNGAVYNQTPVAKFASRKAGEWQTVEATIQGNRITVVLNGVKVHDQVVSDQPTGGELDRDVSAPGPVMIQGDHGSIALRNIRIKELK